MPDPVTPETPASPTGPVARDPLLGTQIPVYLGGEGPVPTPPAGDRGDTVAPAVPAAAVPPAEPAPPAEPVAVPPTAAPVATAPAEPVAAPSAAEVAQPAEPNGEVTQPAAKPERNDKGQFIPRSRFNEVNEERKRLAEENERLKTEKGAITAAEEGAFDFDAKEREHANLVLDGKIDEAVKLRAEIRAAERAEFQKDTAKTTVEATERQSVKQRIDAVTQKYEEALPQFDPEDEAYNEDLLNDVRDFYAGSLQGGRYDDPAKAFEASIEKALKLHGISMPSATPPVAAAAPTPTVPATPAAQARTAEKRVEAIVKQPPSLANMGASGAPETHATIDIKALPDADFAKLPLATRARMRGDYV